MAHLKDLIVNGASRFIGKAYGAFVGSFSGNLDGNATTSTTANTAKACSGNSATATKLQTSRTLSLSGKAAGSTTFDGSTNASINVTSVNADTASKLSTARKINITGNATGAAAFDGTSDVSINVSVSQAAHADKATADANGDNIANTYIRHYQNFRGDINDLKLSGLYAVVSNDIATAEWHYPEPGHAGSILVMNNGANGIDGCTQVYTTYNSHNSYKREYDVSSKTWSAWRRYAFEDSTVASAQKLSTARKINITGNASGSANFDGTSDVSINVNVNESKHAVNADNATHANDVTDAVIRYGVSGTDEKFTAAASGVIGLLKAQTGSNDLTSMNKLRSYIGSVNDGTDWYDVLSIRHRNGAADGQNFGLLMYSGLTNTDSIKYKKQPGSYGWTEERTLLDSSNYNNYAPTKTGGGASGTWGINISGNAKTATTASSVAWSGVTGKPGTYPPSAHNHDSAYPSVTGTRASGTWGISITGNAATATTATTANGLSGDLVFPDIGNTNTSRKISWGGSTDGADIYYQTTASDQGNLVLNLRDDSNCYLCIAANGAFKSYFSPDGVFHGTATSATTATKATQDASGNVIADTYATKAALSTKQEKLTFDTTPTKGSTNPVTSDGIKKAIDAKTIDLSNYYTKAQVDSAISTAISAIVDGNNKSY